MSHSARLRVAALLVLALPVAASAQVGGLINKAKQAVVEKATAKPAGTDDHIGAPFDDATLTSALAGMRAAKAQMNQVAAIQTQFLDNQKRRTALQESSAQKISDYQESYNKVHSCRNDFEASVHGNQNSLIQKKIQELMSDQAAMQRFALESTRLTQAAMDAQAKGDTVAMKKANNDLLKLAGVDAVADSIAAAKKCGPFPQKPAAMDQLDQMTKRNDDLLARLRKSESAVDTLGAEAAGVTPVRFGQMRERLERYVDNTAAFGGKEGEVLKARKSEIEKLVKIP